MRIVLLFIIIFINLTSYSQGEFPDFGNFSADEISLKQCSFDPEAEAVLLLDKAVVRHDDNYRLISERRIRIKILNERGLQRANIVIPFYSKDDFEFISDLRAYTFNPGGAGMQAGMELDKKSIYTEKKNTYYSLLKFAMPAAKAGSILEYHYTSIMKHYGGLSEWEFQSDIPTMKSSYFLEILPNAEFAYNVQKKVDLPIIIKQLPEVGKVYFEMNNVPALRIEPYMDAPRDYIQKVMFQFSGYVGSFGSKQKVNTTWKELAMDMMTEKDFGSQLDKDLKIEEIKSIIQTGVSQEAKLRSIYEFVQKSIVWNGFDGKYAPDGLKAVWDRKKGSAGEINLLLINLLKTADIETFPVLAAERDFGKIDTIYPYVDRFNKTIAFAIADGKQFVLDATQINCPPGLTPYPLLNTTGFLVDKKQYGLIRISPGNKSYKNAITLNGMLDPKGLLTGETIIKSYDYARQYRLTQAKRDRTEFVNTTFVKPYEGITLDSFLVAVPAHDSIPFEQLVKFKQQLNESGGYIFINTNLFTGLEKNPFTSPIRFTNVNFGYPYDVSVEEIIKLPPGSKFDIPEDKLIISRDHKIELSRKVRFENGELKVLLRFAQSITLIHANSYNEMKETYKKIVDLLNEPIVVKLSN